VLEGFDVCVDFIEYAPEMVARARAELRNQWLFDCAGFSLTKNRRFRWRIWATQIHSSITTVISIAVRHPLNSGVVPLEEG
jgi:hypothetical protein